MRLDEKFFWLICVFVLYEKLLWVMVYYRFGDYKENIYIDLFGWLVECI